ncbi:MAG: hypothetical protein K2H59_06240 [Muribaculaceae bacterium]|nr:hypothetical protein [Muribaculaceae bacterium]
MKLWQKIIGIIVGAMVMLFLIALYTIGTKMGFSARLYREADQSEIVARIESYINKNGRLPASLSELGFEQTPGLYCYKGNTLNLIKTGWHSKNEYVLEFWDQDHAPKTWQYSSEDKKWYDHEYFEFEPPLNIDTIRAIYSVYYNPRDNMYLEIDSLQKNENIMLLLDYDSEIKGDSLAYLKFLSGDTLRMEGWVAINSHQLPQYLKEFGTWKYYDQEGNCYRKFWNYKQNGKLIYEVDR